MAKKEEMTKLHLTITKRLRERLRKAKQHPRETFADTITALLDEHDQRKK